MQAKVCVALESLRCYVFFVNDIVFQEIPSLKSNSCSSPWQEFLRTEVPEIIPLKPKSLPTGKKIIWELIGCANSIWWTSSFMEFYKTLQLERSFHNPDLHKPCPWLLSSHVFIVWRKKPKICVLLFTSSMAVSFSSCDTLFPCSSYTDLWTSPNRALAWVVLSAQLILAPTPPSFSS